MRPIILLDVDGVLNISSSIPDDGYSSGILLLAGSRGAHVTVRDDLRSMLDRLALVGDRSVVWIDDRIPDEAWSWAEDRPAATLLVPVDPLLGLGPDQLDVVEEWARERRRA